MVIFYQIRTQVLQFQTLKIWKWPAIWILCIQSMKERHMHDVQSMCNQTMQKKCQKCEVATCTRASVQSVKCNFWLDQVVALGFYYLIMWFSTHLDQFSSVKCQILCKITSSVFFRQIFSFCALHTLKWWQIQKPGIARWCTGDKLCVVPIWVNSEQWPLARMQVSRS